MILFLDASALLKLYREEVGSSTMRALMERTELNDAIFISDVVALEVLVRLAKQGRSSDRKERREARRALAEYTHHRGDLLQQLATETEVVRDAQVAALQYGDSGAGTLDLLHAVFAARLQRRVPHRPLLFVVADRKLRHLAERIGLRTFDPEAEDAAP